MDNYRVVLVRPHYPGNVGSVARVMHNFGLTRLVLVDPLANPLDIEARRLATHGEFILRQAQVVPDLSTALADCVFAAATSANTSGVVRQTGAGSVRSLMPVIVDASQSGPIALVFGPEPTGLTTAEAGQCHYLISIPANPEYPALNLSHAVAICLYELNMHRKNEIAADPIASIAEQERMFIRLRAALERIHFLYGTKADALMHAVRHLIGRARPTPTEIRILHGLARQLEWIAARDHDLPTPQNPNDP